MQENIPVLTTNYLPPSSCILSSNLSAILKLNKISWCSKTYKKIPFVSIVIASSSSLECSTLQLSLITLRLSHELYEIWVLLHSYQKTILMTISGTKQQFQFALVKLFITLLKTVGSYHPIKNWKVYNCLIIIFVLWLSCKGW